MSERWADLNWSLNRTDANFLCGRPDSNPTGMTFKIVFMLDCSVFTLDCSIRKRPSRCSTVLSGTLDAAIEMLDWSVLNLAIEMLLACLNARLT